VCALTADGDHPTHQLLPTNFRLDELCRHEGATGQPSSTGWSRLEKGMNKKILKVSDLPYDTILYRMHVLRKSCKHWKGGKNLGLSDPLVTRTLLLKFIKYLLSCMMPNATTCKVFCIFSVKHTTYDGPIQRVCDRLSRRVLCYTIDQYSDKSFQKSGPTCLEMVDTAHSDVACVQPPTYR
jgi:hypothetical protein